MEKRGFYVNKVDQGQLALFINIEQFKQYLEQQSKEGLNWLRFDIFENKPGAKLSHNIKQNKK